MLFRSQLGGVVNKKTDFNVGDDKLDVQYKSVLSFDTSAIPQNALVTSAQLIMTRKKVLGASPFTVLNRCQVDVLDSGATALALQKTDFQRSATCRSAAQMSNPSQNESSSNGSFNEAGLKSINKGGVTQLRVYFSKPTNNDKTQNLMVFWGDSGLDEQRPKLLITYMLP